MLRLGMQSRLRLGSGDNATESPRHEGVVPMRHGPALGASLHHPGPSQGWGLGYKFLYPPQPFFAHGALCEPRFISCRAPFHE